MDRKILLIAGTIIIVAAVICVVMVFAGGTSITADTPVYENGILKTSVHYDGEQKDVWFQYNIFRQDSLLSSTQVVNSLAVLGTLTKGDSVSELKINLEPGEYKVFIYVLERDEGTKRITGFIRNIVIA
ncbi:MAG TPA: hypothetical protein VJY43_05740 [Methanocorpusculum sp.]|nr:hypothetical protein [Methanocorpusculum sp.]